jgi:hypothetical protein
VTVRYRALPLGEAGEVQMRRDFAA